MYVFEAGFRLIANVFVTRRPTSHLVMHVPPRSPGLYAMAVLDCGACHLAAKTSGAGLAAKTTPLATETLGKISLAFKHLDSLILQ